MADVRCPMCSKLSPADLEICQFCQARLKPLIAPPPTPAEEPPKPSSSGEDEGLPDWLDDLRQQDEGGLEQPAREEALPSWMAGEPALDASHEAAAEEAVDIPDWLSRIGGDSDSDTQAGEPGSGSASPFQDVEGEKELPDWLTETAGDKAGEAQEPDTSGGMSLPAWLAGVPSQTEETSEPDDLSRQEEQESEWLQRIRARIQADDQALPSVPQEEPDLPVTAPGEEPVWESGIPGELPAMELEGLATEGEAKKAEPPEPAGEGLLGWLASLETEGRGEEAPARKEKAEQPAPVEEEPPDWLASLEAEGPGEEAPGGAEEAEQPELEKGELPDWLASLETEGRGVEAPAGMEEAEQPAPVGEEPPDWLASLTAEGPGEEAPGGAEEVEQPELEKGELPDWLASLETEGRGVEAPAGMEEVEQPVPAEEEVPDWLASLETEGRGEEEAPAGMEEAEPPAPAEEGLPDWLAALETEEPAVEPTVDEEEELPELEQGELPDWLAKIGVSPADKPAASGVPAFVLDEEDIAGPSLDEAPEAAIEPSDFSALPDWAAQVSESARLPEEQEGEQDLNLERAELPEWLEAMRPVEAVAPIVPPTDVSDEKVEAAGPLAGLRGVLQVGPDMVRHRKPPIYSIKLQVPEEQQARVDLLEEMLTAEEKPRPVPSQPAITPQYFLRLVIFLALLATVLWTLWVGGGQTPLPATQGLAPEVVDFNARIESLAPGSPVLLAVDYEPGFTSELEPAAAAAISHLASKDVYLALVSTSPSGPAMGERLLANLNGTPEYQQNPFGNYANLGYIPGGLPGLLGFAANPSQVLPYTLEGRDIWNRNPLDSAKGLENFALAIVLTENPDVARAWIEQVQPRLRQAGSSLLMVTSAQAGPMVLPYYHGFTSQVDGVLSGLAGGASYESLTGRPGLSGAFWDAFSASVWVAVFFIILGGFVGVSSYAFDLGKKTKGDRRR